MFLQHPPALYSTPSIEKRWKNMGEVERRGRNVSTEARHINPLKLDYPRTAFKYENNVGRLELLSLVTSPAGHFDSQNVGNYSENPDFWFLVFTKYHIAFTESKVPFSFQQQERGKILQVTQNKAIRVCIVSGRFQGNPRCLRCRLSGLTRHRAWLALFDCFRLTVIVTDTFILALTLN